MGMLPASGLSNAQETQKLSKQHIEEKQIHEVCKHLSHRTVCLARPHSQSSAVHRQYVTAIGRWIFSTRIHEATEVFTPVVHCYG